ncbi:azoR2 [Symbiodinium necroappetens]|uniref:FMN-dependent NADH-azoreductase n=1 Tax=Symbiodinium necroappetens TaxID=1628268 RepID=A0A812J8U2_9DINO|nr:azoR2 [Symbiodinium necroappetens]
MATILRLDTSARAARSITRHLADAFIDAWIAELPESRVTRRDLGRTPPPHVSEEWIAAAFTPQNERTSTMRDALAESDRMIDELAAADLVLVAAPLYNYGLPATLKAWVDQVVRVDRTFTFDLERGDFPIEPVLSGKAMVLLSSRGEFGFGPGGPREGWNHLNPHMRTIATRLLGVADSDFHEVASEFQEFRDERHAHSFKEAERQTRDLATSLAKRLGTAVVT